MNFYNDCLKAVAIGEYCGSAFKGDKGPIDKARLTDDFILWDSANINKLSSATVCTFAIASAIMTGDFNWVKHLKIYGKFYDIEYGDMFNDWLWNNYQDYVSSDSGAAMRCSPIGWYCSSIDDCDEMVEASCKCTHNTKEAIIGAKVLARTIFFAKHGYYKYTIFSGATEGLMDEWRSLPFNKYKQYFRDKGEDVDSVDWYKKCNNIVGVCLLAFMESNNFEEALKLAISEGFDSIALGSIIAPIAYAYYKEIPKKYIDVVTRLFDPNMKTINDTFSNKFVNI